MQITKWDEGTGFTRTDEMDEVDVTMTMDEYKFLKNAYTEAEIEKAYHNGKAQAYENVMMCLERTFPQIHISDDILKGMSK